MKLVSACLVGINCNYKGKSRPNKKLIVMLKRGELIPICPEQLGGLTIPRAPAGIYGGSGKDVLDGKATVRAARNGKDLTKYFVKGAKKVLKIAKLLGIKEVILKARSPSCGCGITWQLDKKFYNHLSKGDGVTTALLKHNGIKVVTEEDI